MTRNGSHDPLLLLLFFSSRSCGSCAHSALMSPVLPVFGDLIFFCSFLRRCFDRDRRQSDSLYATSNTWWMYFQYQSMCGCGCWSPVSTSNYDFMRWTAVVHFCSHAINFFSLHSLSLNREFLLVSRDAIQNMNEYERVATTIDDFDSEHLKSNQIQSPTFYILVGHIVA